MKPGPVRRLVAGILGLTAAAAGVHAGEIYKSFDANGHVVYSDHLDPAKAQSAGAQLVDSGYPPPELHVCWTNCFRLILENGVYRRTDGTNENWTVETFSAKVLVLHRHDAPADWNGFSRDVVYAGHVFHDRLIDVTVDGKPVSGIDAAWGTALNTLPGSNAERDGDYPATSPASVGATLSSAVAPPPLPGEDQPPLSEDGYLWTPGYWSWRSREYFWIPGAWVRPPRVGDLWTPPYWAVAGSVFVFHPGHWGPAVGFYGGVNYGHGYLGTGYTGGHWMGNSFAYNSTVNHLNPAVAQHAYTESSPAQGSRRVASSAAGPPSGAHTTSPHPSPPRAVNKPSATTPGELARGPTPHPEKINHTPTRAAPLKP